MMSLLELFVREIANVAKLPSLDDGFGGEFKRFEALKRMGQRFSGDNHSVIFQNHTVAAVRETLGDSAAQLLAAGQGIRSKTDLAAN